MSPCCLRLPVRPSTFDNDCIGSQHSGDQTHPMRAFTCKWSNTTSPMPCKTPIALAHYPAPVFTHTYDAAVLVCCVSLPSSSHGVRAYDGALVHFTLWLPTFGEQLAYVSFTSISLPTSWHMQAFTRVVFCSACHLQLPNAQLFCSVSLSPCHCSNQLIYLCSCVSLPLCPFVLLPHVCIRHTPATKHVTIIVRLLCTG